MKSIISATVLVAASVVSSAAFAADKQIMKKMEEIHSEMFLEMDTAIEKASFCNITESFTSTVTWEEVKSSAETPMDLFAAFSNFYSARLTVIEYKLDKCSPVTRKQSQEIFSAWEFLQQDYMDVAQHKAAKKFFVEGFANGCDTISFNKNFNYMEFIEGYLQMERCNAI